MSGKRLALVILGSLAVLAAVAAGSLYFAYRNFGALVAQMPEFSEQAEISRQHLARDEASLAAANDEYGRWVHLGDVALGSAIAGDFARSDAMADEVLAMAPRYAKDWNYGNVIHHANLARGHSALARGDLVEARARLLAAGDTPGSPQLDTFGPRMNLARELLRRNERDVVLAYIEKLRRFWEMDAGALDKWTEMILEGKMPNFAMNLY